MWIEIGAPGVSFGAVERERVYIGSDWLDGVVLLWFDLQMPVKSPSLFFFIFSFTD